MSSFAGRHSPPRPKTSGQRKHQSEEMERRRVEEELRQSRNELSAFINNASIGLHSAGPDGIILWANKAELDMLGYTEAEYVGRHISQFHFDPKLADTLFASLARGEKIHDLPAELRCKNGSVKHVLLDVNALWDDGRFVHTQSFTRDVTEQRRSEAISRHMAAIVEHSDDAIVSKDLNGIVTSWNRGAERLFGYRPDEIIGKSILTIIPQERRDEEPRILDAVRNGRTIPPFETIRQRKDGTLIDIALTVSPIKDGKGRVVGVSKIAHDITERKKVERDLQLTRKQLSQANAELEQRVEERTASLKEMTEQMEEFSYTVSHDLRTPLRAMAVYSTALKEDYSRNLPPEAIHYLDRISENALVLDKMILDVLTYSRLARAELRLERVSLAQIVNDIIGPLSELPSHPEFQIDPLPDVVGHRAALSQAISNLLANAVKFVAPGVTPYVRLWTEPSGANVRLWIEDNGIGIPQQFKHRLFGMFERVHPQLNYEGTGVGLAIVRKAVNRMQGAVGVESAGTGGSRFWIELPAPNPL